jgi:predicted dehydrogenase
MPGTGQVRWGIIGTARIARKAFVPAVAAAGGAVTAVAGRDLARASQYAAEIGIGRAVQGYQTLIDDPDLDALYIPLPNALHAEWTIKALRAGKAVLCEKPLCGTLAETEQVLAVARESGTPLWEAFVFPFHQQMAKIRGLLADGAIGDLREIQSNFHFVLDRQDDIRLRRGMDGGPSTTSAATRSGWPWSCSPATWSRPGPPRYLAGTGSTWTCRAAWATPATSG